MPAMQSAIGAAIVCGILMFAPAARGHGRLIQPASRSSMWRSGFNNPPNYDDNGLNCGGFSKQYSDPTNPKCGVCGDPFDEPSPRPNEAGGLYANGIIVETYTKGEMLEIVVEITANHKGWFEFRLCPNNDPSKIVTQECLDRYLLPLSDTSGTVTRRPIDNTHGLHSTLVDLPDDLACTQCVLQWKYNAGNSWGVDPTTGEGGIGYGNQEQFYGCADIAIELGEIQTDSNGGVQDTGDSEDNGGTQSMWGSDSDGGDQGAWESDNSGSDQGTGQSGNNGGDQGTWESDSDGGDQGTEQSDSNGSTQGTGESEDSGDAQSTWESESNGDAQVTGESDNNGGNQDGVGSDSSNCDYLATGAWSGQDSMTQWCAINCPLGNCPASHCTCRRCDTYVAIGVLEGLEFAEEYCSVWCNAGSCSKDMCQCGAPRGDVWNCRASNDIMASLPGMNAFCRVLCMSGVCPSNVCTCVS